MRRVLHCSPEYIYWLVTNPNRDWAKGTAAPWRSWNNFRPSMEAKPKMDAWSKTGRNRPVLRYQYLCGSRYRVHRCLPVEDEPARNLSAKLWLCISIVQGNGCYLVAQTFQTSQCCMISCFGLGWTEISVPSPGIGSTRCFKFPMPSGGPCLNNDLPQHLFLTGTNSPQCSRGLNKI